MNDKEIKVGEYIRTKDGIIAKVTYVDCMMIDCDRNVFDLEHLAMMEIPTEYKEEYIKKHSFNIIDLIEVGDYVNGYEVRGKTKAQGGYVQVDYYMYSEQLGEGRFLTFTEQDIKSIVTKEQFEAAEYKLDN